MKEGGPSVGVRSVDFVVISNLSMYRVNALARKILLLDMNLEFV